MWPESDESPKPLKTGLTTGSCATACCTAAAGLLLLDEHTDVVTITLPKGKQVEMPLLGLVPNPDGAKAWIRKDAGDDPDVTHGATVWVYVQLRAQEGVRFIAGQGVGTVTREGLVLAVGEAAINPVPRQMIQTHLAHIAQKAAYTGGFNVTVGVENGEKIAEKTMNGRLGIVGGLSILGTTGIVRPFSCAAWIASIHQGIDVAKANGLQHLAASTGNASEAAIAKHYALGDMSLIEMGDFAGAVLKHLRKAPIAKLSICGGFGKITKLANRHMDLNSRVSSIDFEHIAAVAASQGASDELIADILAANTSMQALQMCTKANVDLANAMCEQARRFAVSVVPDSVAVEVWAVNRSGEFVGHAGVVTP